MLDGRHQCWSEICAAAKSASPRICLVDLKAIVRERSCGSADGLVSLIAGAVPRMSAGAGISVVLGLGGMSFCDEK